MTVIEFDQWTTPTEPDSRYVVTLYCPLCHFWMGIVGHEIAADGTLSSSVKCPHVPCIFHDEVRLEGWETR